MSANGTAFGFKADETGGRARTALIIPLAAKPQPPLELVARIDPLCSDAVSQLISAGAFGEELGHISHTTSNGPYARVLVVSLGDMQRLTAQGVRKAATAAARWLIAERLKNATLWIDGLATADMEQPVAEWATGMCLAGFRFTSYKEPDKKLPARITVRVRASQAGYVKRAMPEVRQALVVADAVNYARRLGHEPANVLHPAGLASEARRMARETKLRCTVFTADRLRQMKMNGLLAVGQGAAHPSCMIQLEYRGAPRAKALTVLVGKGITFDTGGYSIKSRDGLEKLKFDMCGGAAVLGIMKAAAKLKLKCNLVGLVAAAENAVSDKAYKPGDILRMMSGKTVEITNTDAEGRLVLADALWYAQQKFKPTALIDLATLTGGVIISLGSMAAGIMGNNDDLAAHLGEAGRRTHERLWRLPLWDDYQDLLKSTEADIKNSSSKREAHCIQGGMFLKAFIKDTTPWAHIDIAGVSNPDNGKGATGFGVRLLVEYLRRRGT